MFFLLRMAFWLGLALALLPAGKLLDSEKLPDVAAGDAISAASAAVADMSQFCTRQPAACQVGGQTATVIGQRAQAGARKVYQMMTEKDAVQEAKAEAKPVVNAAPVAIKATFKSEGKGDGKSEPKPHAKGAAKKSPDHTGSIEASSEDDNASLRRDTLTADDLAMEWQLSAVSPVQ